MARARDILGTNNNTVPVIGNGALTGGMALEALNDVGYNKTKMIIILMTMKCPFQKMLEDFQFI